jgi:uncharacterized cofD-like protein
MIGTTLIGLGLGYILVGLYREQAFPDFFYYLTLQFLPRWMRAILVGGLGGSLVALAIFRLSRSLLEPFTRPRSLPVAEAMYQYRQRERGPKIVAIGGGTGLSTFLRGIKAYTSNITAIVTVADDGGSSGRLRDEFGIPPPGDFRQCIAALADDEALTTHLFQYRFSESRPVGNGSGSTGLGGHAFGNLFIAAMTNVTGSFESGLSESSQVLAVRGRVLPSTVTPLTLIADLRDDTTQKLLRVEGESVITHTGATIQHLMIRPEDARAYPDAIRAILDADGIILAPGSLYTSLLPNLLVRGIADAIRAARGPCLYVCNVATQKGETSGYQVIDHINAIERQAGTGLIDRVIANSHTQVEWSGVPPGVGNLIPFSSATRSGLSIAGHDLVDVSAPWRHDSAKLAQAVTQTLRELRPQHKRDSGVWRRRQSRKSY